MLKSYSGGVILPHPNCLTYIKKPNWERVNIHLTTISLLNVHIFKLHENILFAVDFRSSYRSLTTSFCQFSTITATTMSDLFLFLIRFTTVIQIFTALSYNFKSISSTHSKNNAKKKKIKKPHQNVVKSVIKLGAMAVLELVATNKLENQP